MPENYDLHSHSTASDGALSPSELIQRAKEQGVTCLALTDHDTTDGLAEARQAATEAGIDLISGIELSTTWHKHCLHIVGLNIDPESPHLKEGIAKLQTIRGERAEQIAGKLEKKRIFGALEAVKATAGAGMITRTHFADFLLSEGHVTTQQEAFDRYIGQGKPAYVSTEWAGLEEAIGWIKESGGIAVLAHPMRYKLTASWMKRLLTAFKEVGGDAIEVVCGRNDPTEIQTSMQYAQKFDLAGSKGSDFHNPKYVWVELGRLKPLPERIKPVWDLFEAHTY
ncbi:PHP domain-containing protein [Methylotuvimicrobium sp. KM2]|uniref:PHP domain-containing protein n=1 Tax=Methylotuvimicrobium sp. KM2 TaxID=3133976 RepID=UPI0031011E28